MVQFCRCFETAEVAFSYEVKMFEGFFGSVSVTKVMHFGAPSEAEEPPLWLPPWLGGAARHGDAMAGSGVLCSLRHRPAAMLRPQPGLAGRCSRSQRVPCFASQAAACRGGSA